MKNPYLEVDFFVCLFQILLLFLIEMFPFECHKTKVPLTGNDNACRKRTQTTDTCSRSKARENMDEKVARVSKPIV